MRLIEIRALSNGIHQNKRGNFDAVPDGWAIIPDDMETPNFPIGDIECEEKDGIMTVIKWTAKEITKEKTITPIEQLRADVDYIAVMTGVDLI